MHTARQGPSLGAHGRPATISVEMFGGGSIQLGRVFGIRIGVDVSWFFVLFLIIWSFSGYYGDLFPGEDGKAFALATVTALLFFLSILLHELGHALVAIRNGIPISGIDLWMFGGVAKLERDTDSPGVEFRVAVAGPLVTLAIAVVCFGAARGALRLRRRRERVDLPGRELRRGHGRARPSGLDQPLRAALQPDPRLPARRRPDRPGDRLEADRRPQPRHAARRAAGTRRGLPDDRPGRGHVPHRRRGRRALARLHRAVPLAGGALGRGAGGLRRAGSRACAWPT